MGMEIIETKEINGIVYRIQLLDDKYTVYSKNISKADADQNRKDKFSAVASFDNIELARKYIESQEKEI